LVPQLFSQINSVQSYLNLLTIRSNYLKMFETDSNPVAAHSAGTTVTYAWQAFLTKSKAMRHLTFIPIFVQWQ